MSENIALVRALFDAISRNDWSSATGLIATDVVYHNIAFKPIRGLKKLRAVYESSGMEVCELTIHYIAEDGNVVLNERTARIRFSGGTWVSIRIAGAVEIVDGRIKQWRDYFDPSDMF